MGVAPSLAQLDTGVGRRFRPQRTHTWSRSWSAHWAQIRPSGREVLNRAGLRPQRAHRGSVILRCPSWCRACASRTTARGSSGAGSARTDGRSRTYSSRIPGHRPQACSTSARARPAGSAVQDRLQEGARALAAPSWLARSYALELVERCRTSSA